MTVSARHYARLGAVQYLYSWSVQNQSDRVDDQFLIDSNVLLQGDLAYFQKLLRSIVPRVAEIDKCISSAISRKIDAIDPVELAILRLGVYELLFEYDVPLKVITNECIELTREFGNAVSYKFINATLDQLAFGEDLRLRFISGRQYKASDSGEFELIDSYFANRQPADASVLTGIGDDCAIVDIPADQQLLVTTDTLVENVHFLANTHARDVGHKALAVSLSDLAAKGARPIYATLNLSLPDYDKLWLAQFSRGLFDLATRYSVALIGGDTVRGPLSISITAFGVAGAGESPLRSGARPGDGIYITGTLGDAALGLVASRLGQLLDEHDSEHVQKRLDRPDPRVAAGQAIAPIATSSIDLSDGLIADLTHILDASGVGATIELEQIPLSPVYEKLVEKIGWDYALAWGDDYELCFTASSDLPAEVIEKAQVPLHRIGTINEQKGIQIRKSDGKKYVIEATGYVHF